MTRRTNATPFLFRNKKPTVLSQPKSFDISNSVDDGIAIISVEDDHNFSLISANENFLEYVNADDKNPLGSHINNIFWGDNIEDNQLQVNLIKAYKEKQPSAFIWQLTKNQQKKSILCKIIPLYNSSGNIQQITIHTSQYGGAEELEIEVQRHYHYDPLTGLPNRYKLFDILEENIADKDNNYNSTKHEASVLFINVRKLQRVNESYGYDFGDKIIKKVAEKLQSITHDNALLARFANDKFVIFLSEEHFDNVRREARTLAESIHHTFATTPVLSESDIRLAVAIGIATGPATIDEIESTMQNAHLAMRKNNEANTNQTIIFNQELKTQAESRLRLETEFREALDADALKLHYQPLVNLQNGTICGFEALARWNSTVRGSVSPLEFIALAEDAGLIIPLGEWALDTACKQLKSWMNENPLMANMFMAVNVSSTHIITGNIAALTRDALAKSGLNGANLKLELTESTIMENSDIARNILLDLKTLGVSLAVDDFGTGYSSLSYLSRIPADTLKIDRSFISKIDTNDDGLNIIKVIINLANSLGMTVIAEGVETREQMLRLREIGCHYGQGFLFSKPIAPEDIPDFIKNYKMI